MTQPPRIRVLAVDDHPLILAGLAAVVAGEPDLELVAEARDGAAAIAAYRQHRPDVVLMDQRMPDLDGPAAIRAIRGEFGEARIIAISSYQGDEDVYRALEAGASGFLFKDMLRTDVVDAIRKVHAGFRWIPPEVAARLAQHLPRLALTPRELEVLALMVEGRSNPEIARALGRSESTMKVHVRSILQKLGASDRTEAVVTALRRGIVRME